MPRQSRPQKRALETRRLLLEATIDAIIEKGYHRTSTNWIIKRAGVSRGAMLHHYPNKVELLAATFGYIHDQIEVDMEELLVEAQAQGVDWIDLMDVIFERLFSGRTWLAFVEIMVAARTDQELWRKLVPIVMAYYQRIDTLWARYFTTDKMDAEIATLLNLSLCVIRGMALQMMLRDEPAYYENIMRQWKALVEPLIRTKRQAQ